MTGPLQVLLTAGPLAFYFYVLAIWQAGRHPRVISGTVDAALLAFGVGGLLTFGPFGQVVVTTVFGGPSISHWLVFTLVMFLAGLLFARRSAHRLVVYHVEPDVLDQVLEEILEVRTGRHVRTFGGFEDRSRTQGIAVRVAPRLGTAVIEAIGRDAEPRARDLKGRLRARLERAPTPSTAVAGLLYSLSALTMLVSMAGMFLTQPRAREALRVLLQKLQGG